MHRIDWAKQHILKIGNEPDCRDEISGEDVKPLREKIEPWLTAVFQSEHLALMTGPGLTSAITYMWPGANTQRCSVRDYLRKYS